MAMKFLEGKSPAERNKIIAASVLGVLAILSLGYTFFGNPFAAKRKVVISTASPTPTPKSGTGANSEKVAMPSSDEVNSIYTTTPVVYNPSGFYAPDAGRNIFAFYEPPPLTPYVPTPIPTLPPVVLVTPEPPPIPPLLVRFVTPQSVYAGSKTFRMEVNGDKFTPDSLIFFNGNQLPTTYISPQRLVADVPSNFISGAGQIYIIVRTPGGLYSNQVALNVQSPPLPQFQYVGMIARQKFNNDTAYFQEQGKQTPFGARLNDVVGGRFRLASISANETVFEDVNLGFKHRLALFRPPTGQTAGGSGGANNPYPQNPGLGNPGGRSPAGKGIYNPSDPNAQPISTQPGEIPGIPGNIQIYTPPQPPPPNQKDEDEDGDNQ